MNVDWGCCQLWAYLKGWYYFAVLKQVWNKNPLELCPIPSKSSLSHVQDILKTKCFVNNNLEWRGVFTWSLKNSPIKTPAEPSRLWLNASASAFCTLMQKANWSTCGRTCTHRLLKTPIWFVLIAHYKLKSYICYEQTKHRKKHSSWFPGHRRECFSGLGVVFHWLTSYFQRESITPVT